MAHGTATTRPAALAGYFYPADADELRAMVARFMSPAKSPAAAPRALIVPHAGYVYSGSVAGKAYELLQDTGTQFRRVVLLGPTHRVYVRGIAAPTAGQFRTPLGDVVVDSVALNALRKLPQIRFSDEVHAAEHSLEVQLPFLQRVAPGATLMPLAVGDTSPASVAEVIEYFWEDPETLIVISSDLSHFLRYEQAQRRDSDTATSIEHCAGEELSSERACGYLPIAGLLSVAKTHGARVERVDLRNSGDTAGPKDRVVGYGAWAIYGAGQ